MRAADVVVPGELAAPARGSITGSLAAQTFGPEGLASGLLSLPLPLAFPSERVALPVDLAPVYSPGQGISEWGQGFATRLALTRHRDVGDVDFSDGDGLTGAFGPLARGTGGTFMSARPGNDVRVTEEGDARVARLADGSTWYFGTATRLAGPRGTFQWSLDRIETITGVVASFRYEPRAGGHPYLVEVTWGREGHPPDARAAFTYEDVPSPHVDYRAGARIVHDRRVRRVEASTFAPSLGTWAPRWRYDLAYDDAGLGPSFRLASLARTFASGAAEPPMRFHYGDAADRLRQVTAQRDASLDLLDQAGPGGTTPQKVALLDADLDGRIDVEHATTLRLLLRGDDGFTAIAPAAPSDPASLCARTPGATQTPRRYQWIAQLAASEPVTLLAKPSPSARATLVVACTRNGNEVARGTVDGLWDLARGATLVDVTRDHVPDLVRLAGSIVEVAPLAVQRDDRGALTIAAAPLVTTRLEAAPSRDALFFADTNGDGLADLVERIGGTLRAWPGLGGGAFDGTGGTVLPLRSASRGAVPGIDKATLSVLDANGDGVADLLASRAGYVRLFVGTGDAFTEIDVPGLHGVDGALETPFVAVLSGRARAEVAYFRHTAGHAEGYVVPLGSADANLLVSVDDGRGTALRFVYDEARPAPGTPDRGVVLARVETHAVGEGDRVDEYAYEEPALHPRGAYLLGYGHVTRRSALVTASASFRLDPDAGALPRASELTDARVGGLAKVTFAEYEAYDRDGVPALRTKRSGAGFADTRDGATRVSLETTEVRSFARLACAEETVTTNRHGTLTTVRAFADIPAFEGHGACLDARVLTLGAHGDAHFDFRHEQVIERDAAGLVTRVSRIGQDGLRDDVVATYTDAHALASLARPGRGVTTYAYDDSTGLLARVASPDGSAREVLERDPRTDALRSLATIHGTQVNVEELRYDDQERLARRWDSTGHASDDTPAMRFTYDLARTADDVPGAVTTDVLVDRDAARTLRRTTVEWLTATGRPLATLQAIPGGLRVTDLTTYDVAQGATTRWARDAVHDAASMTALLAGAEPIATATTSPLGGALASSEAYEAGVRGETTTRIAWSDGVTQDIFENGALFASRVVDEAGRLLRVRDGDGHAWSYRYDALGRLRQVALPTGESHRVRFDDYGDVESVERDGLGRVDYRHDPATGLLAETRFTAPDGGAPVRRTVLAYDAAGQVVERTFIGADGDEERFESTYDGGFLTGVRGPGFSKSFTFRSDGAPLRVRLTIDGFRTIDVTQTYAEDGSAKGRTTVVEDAGGSVLSSVAQSLRYDDYARRASTTLDGNDVATYRYDADGRLAGVDLIADHDAHATLAIAFDPLTRMATGSTLTTRNGAASAAARRDARGLIAAETFAAGGQTTSRAYRYTAAHALAGFTDEAGATDYAYGGDLLRLASGARASNVSLAIDGHAYALDALGRVARIDDRTITYGPSGHVRSAERAGTRVEYLYDENGLRIAKRAAGRIVAAYPSDGSVLDAERGMIEPFTVEGRIVGLLHHGNAGAPFVALAPTDARGTPFTGDDGSLLVPSPYGVASRRPATADAVAYAKKGWDADLGTITMGARDYDPISGSFLEPDPAFLEDPSRCIANPSECSLYGYAQNDPLSRIDPTGFESTAADREAEHQAELEKSRDAMDAFRAVPGKLARDWHDFVAGVDLGRKGSLRLGQVAETSIDKEGTVAQALGIDGIATFAVPLTPGHYREFELKLQGLSLARDAGGDKLGLSVDHGFKSVHAELTFGIGVSAYFFGRDFGRIEAPVSAKLRIGELTFGGELTPSVDTKPIARAVGHVLLAPFDAVARPVADMMSGFDRFVPHP